MASASSPTALSPKDVQRLLSEPSPDTRAELADKVAASLSGPGLAPGEIALAQDIVRLLARDVEVKVRAAVSHSLRSSPHLPRDVALKLAEDIDLIALPLLAESLVLTDEDLVDLVRRGTPRRQETIAARPNLNETVSDALISHAAEPAVVVLMGNQTARIAEDSLNRAVTRFASSDPVKSAMVARHTLPITVSERLVALVSKELQQHLVKVHALSPGIASDIILRSREHAVIRLSLGSNEAELGRMVAQMHHSGRLSPTLMLRALCTGDIAFFEAAMAVKSDVPVANAQILIHEPSRRGLAAIYRKAAMPEQLFDAVRTAVEVVDETGFDGDPRDLERFRARVITRILTLAETIDTADADYLTDKLGDILVPAAASTDLPLNLAPPSRGVATP
jgi:uncharacterized protein (DUF2336 family)